MIEYNKILPTWIIKLVFFRVDFVRKGDYERKQFISYEKYREDY